jgi:hypothetical protein
MVAEYTKCLSQLKRVVDQESNNEQSRKMEASEIEKEMNARISKHFY